jgi:hypothetical protein
MSLHAALQNIPTARGFVSRTQLGIPTIDYLPSRTFDPLFPAVVVQKRQGEEPHDTGSKGVSQGNSTGGINIDEGRDSHPVLRAGLTPCVAVTSIRPVVQVGSDTASHSGHRLLGVSANQTTENRVCGKEGEDGAFRKIEEIPRAVREALYLLQQCLPILAVNCWFHFMRPYEWRLHNEKEELDESCVRKWR